MVTTNTTTNALTTSTPAGGDGWDTNLPETGGLLHGKTVKFRDGKYFADKTADITGKILVAADIVACWVRWWDGKPTEHKITEPGQLHPERDELGDDDEAQWQEGLDGEPTDPWADTRYARLFDPKTAEEFTFTTSSIGGRRAVRDLQRQVMRMRSATPGALPIVKLEVAEMPTRFGMKTKPAFTVVDWIIPTPATPASPHSLKAPHHDRSGRDDMNDEIPF
jgi:hypothetical protein